MTSLFMKILNMSITASIVISAVLIVLFILQRLKAPRKYSYLLWLAAAFRLCCPVSLKSVFSVFGGLRYISPAPAAASGGATLEYISIPSVTAAPAVSAAPAAAVINQYHRSFSIYFDCFSCVK